MRPWTDSVHALLRFLEQASFVRSPRPQGFDDQGREVLSYLPGNTIGGQRPWPKWVHSDEALVQVAHWLRSYHQRHGLLPPAMEVSKTLILRTRQICSAA